MNDNILRIIKNIDFSQYGLDVFEDEITLIDDPCGNNLYAAIIPFEYNHCGNSIIIAIDREIDDQWISYAVDCIKREQNER